MKLGKLTALGALLLIGGWWLAATPPAHHRVPDVIRFDNRLTVEIAAVDHSADFARALQVLPSDMPGHDDLVFLHGGQQALASGMDGKLWLYDFTSRQAEVFLDTPLMAAGLHESPGDPDTLYFCASHLWGDHYPATERVGLYRLQLSTRRLTPVVLDVPDTAIDGPKVWPLDDARAPRLIQGSADAHKRPLAFCNDLEISADGQRIYFSEPFAYAGASMGGGTLPEVLAYHGNGRIWQHDLATGETRLVAAGYFFPDGILYDLHPGQARETSILTSQTAGFRITRLFVAGPRAGTDEVVLDGMPGMCDGMDRDTKGRIWCGMYARRSALISWLHEHPWLKHILLRLPLNWMDQPRETGVLALSADAATPLYSAWYEGPKAVHIASAFPGPDGQIYVTPFSREHRGLVRFSDPLP